MEKTENMQLKIDDGELQSQGIGSTVQQGGATVTVVDGVKTIVRSNG